MRTIFAYGLLKPGFSLHHVVEPFVELATDGRTRGRLYDAGVPAARFDEEGEITGVVYWLAERKLEEALRVLDELEDEGEDYRRIVVDVDTSDGPVRAFAYEYLKPLDGHRDAGSVWG